MSRFTCTAATLILLVFSPFLHGGEIVAVLLLEEKADKEARQIPATQPSADATMLLSIEALTDASGNFHASCLVGDKTIWLDGNVKTMTDGTRRLKIDFLHQDEFRPGAFNTESITSNIVMHAGEQRVIGGMHGATAAGQRFIVATIKPPPESAKDSAKAE